MPFKDITVITSGLFEVTNEHVRMKCQTLLLALTLTKPVTAVPSLFTFEWHLLWLIYMLLNANLSCWVSCTLKWTNTPPAGGSELLALDHFSLVSLPFCQSHTLYERLHLYWKKKKIEWRHIYKYTPKEFVLCVLFSACSTINEQAYFKALWKAFE